MSVSDLFAPVRAGAALVLIGEATVRNPLRLAERIAETGITFWFSTPSALIALEQFGRLERFPVPRFRHLLFAGEPFPIPRLRAVMRRWPGPRYVNIYGSTETNMRAMYEVPPHLPEETTSLPLGRPFNGYDFRIDDPGADGCGELLVTGPALMSGYWRRSGLDDETFDRDAGGVRWFRTGDLASTDASGAFVFRGRRDRMVKRHGYRIELAEVEAAVAQHPEVREAAAVATASTEGLRILVFVTTHNGTTVSQIEIRRFCMQRLPSWMIPDAFPPLDAMPLTATGKIDYLALGRAATQEPHDA
jgi:acyl-coenzyme A synthetase/AMP-(fatty) acid ligase